MSWNPIWEDIFAERDWGQYPPEELIRFIARRFYAVPDRSQIKILEIGCGQGANIWYLAREGFEAYGIDGSPSGIHKAERRLQADGLTAHFLVGDVVSLSALYPPAAFDAVIDVACLQHNRLSSVQEILEQVRAVLKPEGQFFSIMLASGSWGEGSGFMEEPNTYSEVSEGPLRQRGLCHFFTKEELSALFAKFLSVECEYRTRSLEAETRVMKHWIFQGTKAG